MGPRFSRKRGLIEARFVKPVYDGETAGSRVGRRTRRRAYRSRSKSRTSSARPGRARLPAVRASRLLMSDFSRNRAVARAQARRPQRRHYELGKWLGTLPRAPEAGDGGTGISRRRARDRCDLTPAKALGHPGLLQRVMNKVLVDNAILGPVDPCRQPDAASQRLQQWRRD